MQKHIQRNPGPVDRYGLNEAPVLAVYMSPYISQKVRNGIE